MEAGEIRIILPAQGPELLLSPEPRLRRPDVRMPFVVAAPSPSAELEHPLLHAGLYCLVHDGPGLLEGHHRVEPALGRQVRRYRQPAILVALRLLRLRQGEADAASADEAPGVRVRVDLRVEPVPDAILLCPAAKQLGEPHVAVIGEAVAQPPRAPPLVQRAEPARRGEAADVRHPRVGVAVGHQHHPSVPVTSLQPAEPSHVDPLARVAQEAVIEPVARLADDHARLDRQHERLGLDGRRIDEARDFVAYVTDVHGDPGPVQGICTSETPNRFAEPVQQRATHAAGLRSEPEPARIGFLDSQVSPKPRQPVLQGTFVLYGDGAVTPLDSARLHGNSARCVRIQLEPQMVVLRLEHGLRSCHYPFPPLFRRASQVFIARTQPRSTLSCFRRRPR